MKNSTLGAIISFILIIVFSSSAFAQAPIKIVSGIQGEVYDQFAHDIQNNTHVNLKIYQTRGSLDNMDFLLTDSIQMGFVQYDVLKTNRLGKGIEQYIKVFLPLYSEEIHLIVRRSSDINSVSDLDGKRVGIGGKNSGTHVSALIIKDLEKLDWKTINIDFNESVKALLADSIDAFFYVGAAPSSYLSKLDPAISSQLKLANVRGSNLNDIYENKKIKSNIYSWNTKDVKTIGVRSLLVVNTNNIDSATATQIDILYDDLSDNLKGIQWNKFSHPKWKQVDFGDMNHIDWPVYKEKYIFTLDNAFFAMAIIAAILSFIQIYFIINKLWKRKHEQIVAESISISAMFISIFINGFFAARNMSSGSIPQLSANLMWITASIISMIIGVGFYVATNRGRSFFNLLLSALNMERKEAGDLAMVFFKPSGAAKIIEILGRVAMVDNDLDETEKEFIQGFADNWGIKIDWDRIAKYADESEQRFRELRKAMSSYLSTSPPKEQASQLMDVISLLVNVDGVLTDEEDLMLSELTGLIMKYLGKGTEVDVYRVAVVPQSKEQEEAIEGLLKDLTKEHIAGGWAYVSESYYSERYAGIISAQYRALKVFSVVFKPNNMEQLEKYVKEKEQEKKQEA
jgi:TRAP transporter TAXI family solute receptor